MTAIDQAVAAVVSADSWDKRGPAISSPTPTTNWSTEQAQPVTYARLEAAGGTDAVCRSCWTIHAGECI